MVFKLKQARKLFFPTFRPAHRLKNDGNYRKTIHEDYYLNVSLVPGIICLRLFTPDIFRP